MNRFLIIYICLLSFALRNIAAQEVLTAPTGNNRLSAADQKSGGLSKGATDTLNLPFFDDFSYMGPYPDSKRWADNFVFINNTFTVNQLTTGVATFDLLDNNGRLYEEAETFVFRADMLTSNHINLSLNASDSIWFSFLYQPAGIGDAPEAGDSLTLQFWAPETAAWKSIWKAEGTSLHPFRAVMIPVKQEEYLKKGFRFRFTAYGSLSQSVSDPAMKTSGDNWNIDYVRLDKNRHYDDTVMHDVAFTLPLRSLLMTHESIPLKHFRQIYLSEMGSFIPVTYRNNDTILRNVTRQFEIRNMNTGTVVHSFSGGATNTEPLTNIAYNAPLFFTYDLTGTDTIAYQVKSYLITDDFDPRSNDTTTYHQVFGNVFSIDDGSAEAGYGINGQGARNAMVAYRYRAFVPDSLRAIIICFNDSYENSNLRAFDLAVWSNNGGIPGDLLYRGEEVMVEQGVGLNGFHTYVLDDPVYVDNIFFIGWIQRSETFLNAAIDLNTGHAGRQYYWLNGDWYQSQVNGTLMIRAVTGPKIPSTGIGDIHGNTGSIKIWPNPVRDILKTEVNEAIASDISFVIFDLSGRTVLQMAGNTDIDVSSLRPGVYVLVATHNGRVVGRNRFIKAG